MEAGHQDSIESRRRRILRRDITNASGIFPFTPISSAIRNATTDNNGNTTASILDHLSSAPLITQLS
jgi:hypothetical protein